MQRRINLLIKFSNSPKHLIIISLDALSSLDFDIMLTLPNFNSYLQQASYCRKVYSVYPSLTYPAHTSIITGQYPGNHGVVNNTFLQENSKDPDWYWYRKYIKSDTLYDKAIDNGLKVAALLWPVTGKSRIQYNMPEIYANKPWQNQITVSLLSGSPFYQIELNSKFGHLRNGKKEPELDNFVHQSVLYTIKKKKPNLILIHYTDLDAQRHHFGFNSRESKDALKRHDARLGDIINTLKSEGIYSESAIVILGDHSSLDENKIIKINVLLKDKGFISIDHKGKIKSFKAICKSCDGSAYIYLKDRNDKVVLESIHALLKDISANPNAYGYNDIGIEALYNSEEAYAKGADFNCAFMLEAKNDYYFNDEYTGKLIEELDFSKGSSSHYTKATHGYSPFKDNYTTMFFASGKGFKSGVVIDSMNLIDEGPTLAKLMNLTLEKADGKVIEAFLEA
jgi:predicted AlkP superfamily pyrophosphatase or phosphodiesterase